MSLNVNDITDTLVNGAEPKEVYKKVFEEIGHHFINNAERLSSNIIDIHAGMKIEIDIPVSGIVKIDTTNTEYVIKKKTIGGK